MYNIQQTTKIILISNIFNLSNIMKDKINNKFFDYVI